MVVRCMLPVAVPVLRFFWLLAVVCCLACMCVCRLLFVFCCLLCVVRGTWFVVRCCCWLLPVVCYVVCVSWFVFVVHVCLLFDGCCLLFVVLLAAR